MTEPSAEPPLRIPEAVERSRGGNHSAVSFTAAGQFPASPTRRVKSARPRRRVQGEPIERRAQWLVVGQGMRLEGREATHPLRPGRRRLARDGGGGEVAFRFALPVRHGLIPKGPEQAAPAKVPLDAADQALEHFPHLAGPHVPEPLPGELAAVLVPGPVQDDEVEVRVQSQIGRRSAPSPPRCA